MITQRGLMLILSSPSGAGKTSIARELLKRDERIKLSVSHTTRDKRETEQEGEDYYFVDLETFCKLQENGTFLESAEVFGNLYGSSRYQVQKVLSEGYDLLFDIDWQGLRTLVATVPEDVVSIFILPPSNHELLRRVNTRAQDAPDIIANRMAKAESEISHWDEYDYVIINDDFDASIKQIREIIEVERWKRHRQIGLQEFIDGLCS
ncbi:MAG: guanylate kinase [Pseudomonadota bacterium]